MYVCPKCTGVTCSVECYKGHSETCVEAFYKTMVEEHLKTQQGGDGSVQGVYEALARTAGLEKHLDNVTDEALFPGEEGGEQGGEEEWVEELEALAARVAGGDIPEWNELSMGVRKALEEDLAAGVVGQVVGLWNPWWEEEGGWDLYAAGEGSGGGVGGNPAVALGVVAAVAGGVVMMRRYNGEIVWEGGEGLAALALAGRVGVEGLGGGREAPAPPDVVAAIEAAPEEGLILGVGVLVGNLVDRVREEGVVGGEVMVGDLMSVFGEVGKVGRMLEELGGAFGNGVRVARGLGDKEAKGRFKRVKAKLGYLSVWWRSPETNALRVCRDVSKGLMMAGEMVGGGG